jgi:hypothetical protein
VRLAWVGGAAHGSFLVQFGITAEREIDYLITRIDVGDSSVETLEILRPRNRDADPCIYFYYDMIMNIAANDAPDLSTVTIPSAFIRVHLRFRPLPHQMEKPLMSANERGFPVP